MSSIQYTIRAVPKPVDKELRRLAKVWDVSLNEAAIKAFKMATGKSEEAVVYHDLDHIKNSGIADEKAFDGAMKWQESLPVDTEFKL